MSSPDLNHETVVRVDKLFKNYGKTVGVNDISFEVEKGEIFGFLGPNGSGKTTTIRLLLDLLKPDSGNITIFGKTLKAFSHDIRKNCGYLPGEFQAYKNLTGNQYLELYAKFRKTEKSDLGFLMDKFDLSQKDLNRKTSQYSRGMMQKIGIIQAFMHKPKLIILDEPTTGLDPLMQEVFYELIFQKQSEGSTIFFSSHNLPEVEKLCTRLAIIKNGSIVSVESMSSLKRKIGLEMSLELSENHKTLNIPGTELLSQHENLFVFKIKGEINEVLQKVSTLPVKDITISKPSLENVFMSYYKNN